ncbi:DNA replication protein SLD5 KNAG_0K02130 [Huiozyma naganishii CBS 8797]|uniref:DNA replication complex GINS protein SLD5 n=1 Tax=Huiozyma naganishii (strain ATCC MYA-139 / BCRC 22969 / CBS 8797 / KCTC 17520 / NBRC 10181 / NCYC 3082 / Yp74L-3) TaxID=1071383 RepID=J7SAY7_HUIN7|nr:hypothetical protein KNAG_0K02130 [Kazachstania naganishii CBS 8797]CCK72576.1 hypothetical protein KNAG_0K02130 [Kazachstania naganishii CBS 8797]
MDINIEDILAELDRDSTTVVEPWSTSQQMRGPSDDVSTVLNSLPPTSTAAAAQGKQLGGSLLAREDYECLVAHWRNERCSPEILPYPHALMRRMLHRVQEQMEQLEAISMNFMDPDAMAAGSDVSGPANNNSMLPLLCMEAELERVRFVVRSYVRCRFAKVDRFSTYLEQLHGVAPQQFEELLSPEEIEYHARHFAILLDLFNNTVLKHMPAELQAINDTEGSVNMVDEPDWNRFVFVRVVGPRDGKLELDPQLITLPNGKHCYTVTIPELQEDVECTIGSIYVMRYAVIKDLLMQNKVELI